MRIFKVPSGAQNPNFLTLLTAIAGLFAVYVPIAIFLQYTYVAPTVPPGTVLELERPFASLPPVYGNAYYAEAPSLDGEADVTEDPDRSPYIIYEDDRRLGPAHARHDYIAELGHGRFSHWPGIGFVFSSSDGTSPASNGRKYRVVRPPAPPAGIVAELRHPVRQGEGFADVVPAPALDDLADSDDDPERSPYVVYEDDLRLGPAHSIHSDISNLGHGRFSHWKGVGFIFSTSDGTDPASNGRRYWVVRPTAPRAGVVAELRHPIGQGRGFANIVAAPALDNLADTNDAPRRSPYVIYEDDQPLGPAHSIHSEISDLGHGRFSHWKDIGFIFSSSDGTDPSTNGRRYWAVLPPEPQVGVVAELINPVRPGGGYTNIVAAPALDNLADTNDAPQRSPYVIYEDDMPLGPAHTIHSEITKLGHGRFSHWKDIGFIFSSSDGTDPGSNGRRYWVVLPK